MKRTLVLLTMLTALSISVSACSASARELPSVAVSCDDFQKSNHITRQVELRAGDTLTVKLCSNPSTGFTWESATISDPSVLQQVDQKYVAPTSGAPGAAGQEVWTLKAAGAGSSKLSVAYSRPWSGGEKAVWTFTLEAVVK